MRMMATMTTNTNTTASTMVATSTWTFLIPALGRERFTPAQCKICWDLSSGWQGPLWWQLFLYRQCHVSLTRSL